MPGECTVVLLRHGESVYNAAQRFTGLLDPPLTRHGVCGAGSAAQQLRRAGLEPTVIVSSPLERAMRTADLVRTALGIADVPVVGAWQLAERDYGTLTGMAKRHVLERFGADAFTTWRRTVDGAPPPASPRQIATWECMPPPAVAEHLEVGAGESSREVIGRVRPWWDQTRDRLPPGACALLVAHGNSLRALRAILERLDDATLTGVNIPPTQPWVATLDGATPTAPVHGRYLDVPDAMAGIRRIEAAGGT